MKTVDESFVFTQEPKTAVSLVEYCKYLGYSEYAFFGITNPDDANTPCQVVWTQRQRNLILSALVRAQTQIEDKINYYLSPIWTAAESHYPTQPIHLDKCYVRALGVKSDVLLDTLTVIFGELYAGEDETLNSPVYVDLITDESIDNIALRYPISLAEIIPSSIDTISGGYRIYIPLSRLATESMIDGQIYNARDLSSYQQTISAYLITTVEPYASIISASQSSYCEDITSEPDCAVIIDSKLSTVRISRKICSYKKSVSINYLSYRTPDDVLKTAIIRLAHTFLESEPCKCDKIRYIWERDRVESDDADVSNCPFGNLVGAVFAWKVAQKYRVIRGVLL